VVRVHVRPFHFLSKFKLLRGPWLSPRTLLAVTETGKGTIILACRFEIQAARHLNQTRGVHTGGRSLTNHERLLSCVHGRIHATTRAAGSRLLRTEADYG
jgi:hypothetical protein